MGLIFGLEEGDDSCTKRMRCPPAHELYQVRLSAQAQSLTTPSFFLGACHTRVYKKGMGDF
eukprot:1178722-Prorocentrum_minimum.AAC.5